MALLLCVGPLAAQIAEGFDGQSCSVADASAAAELLPGMLRGGDTVLLKASRGVGLERVAEALRAAGPLAGAIPGQN